jgi:hypothetical protein
MSAFVALRTPMVDRECLLLALADVGFEAERVEVHATAQALVGYQGDTRADRAHVIVRRRYLRAGSNDLGFVETELGWTAVISDFDRTNGFGAAWLGRIQDRYEHHRAEKVRIAEEEERRRIEEEQRRLVEAQRARIVERAQKLGYRVEEKREAGKVRIVLRRRSD